jgi:hypothetical protein
LVNNNLGLQISKAETPEITTYNYDQVYLWMWYGSCDNITSDLTHWIDITTQEWQNQYASKFCKFMWHSYDPSTVSFTCIDMWWEYNANNHASSLYVSGNAIRRFDYWLDDDNYTIWWNHWSAYYPTLDSVTCYD